MYFCPIRNQPAGAQWQGSLDGFGEPGCPSDVGARLCFSEKVRNIHERPFGLIQGSQTTLTPTSPGARSIVHCDSSAYEWDGSIHFHCGETQSTWASCPSTGSCKNYGSQQWTIICFLWASGFGRQSKTNLAHQSLGLSL